MACMKRPTIIALFTHRGLDDGQDTKRDSGYHRNYPRGVGENALAKLHYVKKLANNNEFVGQLDGLWHVEMLGSGKTSAQQVVQLVGRWSCMSATSSFVHVVQQVGQLVHVVEFGQ
jgi:hypothetical protein